MRCFRPCFGASKNRKPQSKPNIVVPFGGQRHGACETLQPTKPSKQEVADNIEPNNDSKNKDEEQSEGSIRKRVTFDSNVKTHEEFPPQEIKNCSVELGNAEKQGKKKEETKHESQTQSDSSMSSVFSYPPRYGSHNCTNSGDGESESVELLESDFDDNDPSESCFSISIESRKHISASEIDEKEVNSPITIGSLTDNKQKSIGLSHSERSKYLVSVLNPVENLTQWKRIKSTKSAQLKGQEKENIYVEEVSFSEKPHLKSSNRSNFEFDDIAVDTSLSSWLVESETPPPISKNSPKSVGNSPGRVNSSRSYEDRPILGALTVQELKELSATSSSPRRTSRSQSPDEMPIIGTVGSYWKHIEG